MALVSLAMIPVLVWMHVLLAHSEERHTLAEFGSAYARHAEAVAGFLPRLTRLGEQL